MEKKWIKYMASLFLGIIIILLLFSLTSVDKVIPILYKLNWWWLLPILAIYSLDWIIRGERWRVLLAQNNVEIALQESVMLTILGNFANLVIPAKLGDLARIYGAKKRHDIRFSIGLTTVILDRFLDFVAVLALTLVSLIFLAKAGMPAWSNSFIYVGIMVVLIFIVFILLLRRNMLLVGPLKRFERHCTTIQNSFLDSTKHEKTFIRLTTYSMVIWFIEALVTYFLLLAVSSPAPLPVAVFAIMIANLTKTLPITPSGLGVYEGAMAAVFVANGLPYEIGLTISLIDHGIKNLYTLIIGGVAVAVLGVDIKSIGR